MFFFDNDNSTLGTTVWDILDGWGGSYAPTSSSGTSNTPGWSVWWQPGNPGGPNAPAATPAANPPAAAPGPAPGPNRPNNPNQKSIVDQIGEWAAKPENQTTLMIGGVAVALLLTKKK